MTRPLLWQLDRGSPFVFQASSFDVPFNAYVLSWVAHALTTSPSRLFDANIYHPVPDALAYTEHMLGSFPFFAPGFLLTGNPVVGLNGMILAGLVLSAFGTYFVTWHWTGSRLAAIFAGLLFGFYPAHVRALGPNLVTLQYFPFILYFLDRLLERPERYAMAGLTVALFGQCASSYYYAYPAVLATAVAAAAVCLFARVPRPGAALVRVGSAIAVTACAITLLSLPYFRVAAGGLHTIYGPNLVATFGTSAQGLLWRLVDVLSPTPLLLAGSAVVLAVSTKTEAVTRRRVLMLVVWVGLGLLLSSGPMVFLGGSTLPTPSRWLSEYAPGFAALRDVRRLFVTAPVALSILAGFGIVALSRMAGSEASRKVLGGALFVVAVLVTALSVDTRPLQILPLSSGEHVPEVYRALGRLERGPVLELPIGAGNVHSVSVRQQTQYEYFSIFHRQPILNGYTSYWPPEFEATMAMARALPDARALANLVACTAVKWIVVHTSELSPAKLDAWEQPVPGLEQVGDFGADRLYRVRLARKAPCAVSLEQHGARDESLTLEGTPRTPVSARDRRASIQDVGVSSRLSNNPPLASAYEVPVTVENRGGSTWPGIGVGERGLVLVRYRWLDANGRAVALRLPPPPARLPVDLAPGERVTLPLTLHVPSSPGDYQLELQVTQDDVLFQAEGAVRTPVSIFADAHSAAETTIG